VFLAVDTAGNIASTIGEVANVFVIGSREREIPEEPERHDASHDANRAACLGQEVKEREPHETADDAKLVEAHLLKVAEVMQGLKPSSSLAAAPALAAASKRSSNRQTGGRKNRSPKPTAKKRRSARKAA
jgi:hypothetical protein